MGGERIDRHPDQPAGPAYLCEESLVGRPDPGEASRLDRNALLGSRVADHGHLEGRGGQFVRFDGGPVGVGFEERNPGAQPGGGHPIGVRKSHPTHPVSASAMSPEGPWNGGELGVTALLAEVLEALQESLARAVPRVAPHLAIGLAGLLVGGAQQGALVLAGQGLPVKVPGSRESRLAGTLPASVLVDDHPAQFFHSLGYPDRILDGKDQFPRLGRGLVAHAVVGGSASG